MSVGAGNNRLLGAIEQLCAELGGASGAPPNGMGKVSEFSAAAFAGTLAPRDEELVIAVRDGLGRVASAACARSGGLDSQGEAAIVGALGGAELAMRSQLVSGDGERLAGMVPGFAYLVTLPALGDAEAQTIAERAEELLYRRADGQADPGDGRALDG